MNLITQSEFARQLTITRQAVNDAKKKGSIDMVKQGKKNLVDLDGYKTKKYIKNKNFQRKSLQKKEIKELQVRAKDKTPEEIAKLLKEADVFNLVYQKARAEAKQEDVKKKRLELLYRRGELIDKQAVYESVMFFFG